jgi:LysM repeat protein
MTIDRHDPAAPPALQDEFWGDQTDWTGSERRPSRPRAGVGATIGRWWDGLLGAGSDGERVHGRATGSVTPHSGDQQGEIDDDHVEHDDWAAPVVADDGPGDEHDDPWTFAPEPEKRRPGVDPLLARFGGLAVVLTLAVPVVMGFTSNSADDPSAATSATGPAVIADLPSAVPTPPAGPVESMAQADAEPTADATVQAAAPAAPAAAVADTGDEAASEPVVAAALEADVPATAPPVTEPPCGNDYELAAGDYWIRIADAADVELADLLAVNDASVDTVLVPGRSICLPVGASTPAPPTTSAPRAGETTATTAPPTRSGASTPTVTPAPPAPTTTVPARPASASAAEAVAIIRSVWPDELEERAIEIAWRESNHRSNVNNWCCYGLFQIHWEAHRSWLSSIGVTSAWQLYDAKTNAVAAYTLYQRAGGFGPWGG